MVGKLESQVDEIGVTERKTSAAADFYRRRSTCILSTIRTSLSGFMWRWENEAAEKMLIDFKNTEKDVSPVPKNDQPEQRSGRLSSIILTSRRQDVGTVSRWSWTCRKIRFPYCSGFYTAAYCGKMHLYSLEEVSTYRGPGAISILTYI